MIPLIVAAAAFVPMILEAIVSTRHERLLIAQGAVEPQDDVIAIMRLAYPGAFAAMVAEAWLRRPVIDDVFLSGATLFVVAKALKYWAIATLGHALDLSRAGPSTVGSDHDRPLCVDAPPQLRRRCR